MDQDGCGACQILYFCDSQVIPYKARGLHRIDMFMGEKVR